MKFIKDKLKSKHVLFFLITLLFVLAIEIFVFVCDPKISGKGNEILVTDKHEYTSSNFDCTFDGATYKVTGADPQIIYTGISQKTRSIVLELRNPSFSSFNVKLYYETPVVGFSETTALIEHIGPYKNQVIFKLPGDEITAVRFDIDRDVEILSITLWDSGVSMGLTAVDRFSVARVLIMFVITTFMGVLACVWYRGKGKRNSLTSAELWFLVLCFVYFTLWNFMQPFNYAPDEAMRFDVTYFFFEHGRLPVGDELTHSIWGFSYAHMPTVLCNILGCLFMNLASPFTTETIHLVFASRMVSVLAGTGTVYFVIKSTKYLFNSPSKWIMIVLVAFIPQFSFISSYVNNDSLAVLGAAIIFYAWIYVINNKWTYSIATLLAVGMAICALSYYNSYGWILVSIIFSIITYFKQNPRIYRGFFKLAGFVSAFTLILISYFFVRHFVLYGDILGMSTGQKYGELYAQPGMKPSERFSLSEQGVGITNMLFSTTYSWVNFTVKSFFAVFGYMEYYAPNDIYNFYSIVFGLGMFSFVALFVYKIIKRQRIPFYTVLLYISIAAVAVITVFLSIYNSYFNDFQPQGRYCYPALIPAVLVVSRGLDYLISLLKKETYRYFAVGAVCSAFIVVSLLVFKTVFVKSCI